MTDIVESARALKKKANEAIDKAGQPDQKLAAMANYGDIALNLVSAMGIEIERLQGVEAAAEEALSEWADGTSETGLSSAMQTLASAIFSEQ